ncbi:hypothetical protein [Chroococcidiopsis cubana]|uniref:hypothetical protein n=1 Tax=Chroococcidiopsis cubana TaxID=171392 RepID=UPI002ACDEBB5|nr:hypothetical protein [Chroococcidiopsis cubana]
MFDLRESGVVGAGFFEDPGEQQIVPLSKPACTGIGERRPRERGDKGEGRQGRGGDKGDKGEGRQGRGETRERGRQGRQGRQGE